MRCSSKVPEEFEAGLYGYTYLEDESLMPGGARLPGLRMQ